MEFFNGVQLEEVSKIDCLENMTQEIANAIATGPQDAFFEALDAFNRNMSFGTVGQIEITDKWNWKPGTYDKIDKMIRRKLCNHSGNIFKRLEKTRTNSNYLGYVIAQAKRLEEAKYTMKNSGLTRNVNIEDFQDISNQLVKTLNSQADLAYDMSDGCVQIQTFIRNDFKNRTNPIYVSIKMDNLTMSVFDGTKCIQEIPLLPLHVIINYPLRHYINKLNTNWSLRGTYNNNDNHLFSFPYISHQNSRNYRQGDMYGTVCLDKYNDNIKDSFLNRDFIQMSMHLMNWAQYYSIKHANPYNNPKFLHIGIPKSYSKEYKATLSSVKSSCADRLTHRVRPEGHYLLNLKDRYVDDISECNKIECQLKTSCDFHMTRYFRIKAENELSDNYCMMEAMVGYIIEYYTDKKCTYMEIYNHLADTCEYYISSPRKIEFLTYEDFCIHVIDTIFTISRGLTNNNLINVFSLLLHVFDYNTEFKEENEEALKPSSDEEIKQSMVAWATERGI